MKEVIIVFTAIENAFPHLIAERDQRDLVLLPDDGGPRGWIQNRFLYQALDEISPDLSDSVIFFIRLLAGSQSEPVTPFVIFKIAERVHALTTSGEDFSVALRDFVVDKNGTFSR